MSGANAAGVFGDGDFDHGVYAAMDGGRRVPRAVRGLT